MNIRITMITEENKTFFSSFMPEEIWNSSDFILGAVHEETACGILAVSELEENILSISYLFVAEEFRRKHIAFALLTELHEYASKVGYDMTICQFMLNADTEAFSQCLTVGLFEEDELRSLIYRIRFEDLSQKLLWREKKAENVLSLSKTSRMKWNELLGYLEKNNNKQGTIPELKDISAYEQDASFLLLDKGMVKGCILFEQQQDDYILSYVCIFDQTNPIQMMVLLQESYRVLKEQCTSNTSIYVNALTETSQKLVLQITEGKAELLGEAVTKYCTY